MKHARPSARTASPPSSGGLSGFTLIEILLAVTVFSIVLAAISTVFYSALRLRNKSAAAFDLAIPRQRALALMRQDMANLVAPGGTLSGSLQSTLLNTTTTSSGSSSSSASATSSSSSLLTASGTPLTAIPIMGAVDASPYFYTATGALEDTSPWADIQQVCYVLMSPSNTTTQGKDLVRCVTRNLLPVATPDLPTQERLVGGVQEMVFQFYDGNQWQTTWDTTLTTNTLPLAIKVQLQFAPESEQQPLPPPVELVVPILVQARTNQTAQTTAATQ